MKNLLCSIVLLYSLTACNVNLDNIPSLSKLNTKDMSQGSEINTNKLASNTIPIKGIQLGLSKMITIFEKEKLEVTANVLYQDGSFDSAYTISSNDISIVSVNDTTKTISGVRPGIASIFVKSIRDSSKEEKITVVVKKGEVKEALSVISPKSSNLFVGETVRLNGKIQMSDGTYSPNLKWESDNEAIAIVSGNGLVTATGLGKTTITAIASGDSTKKASAIINVTDENQLDE